MKESLTPTPYPNKWKEPMNVNEESDLTKWALLTSQKQRWEETLTEKEEGMNDLERTIAAPIIVERGPERRWKELDNIALKTTVNESKLHRTSVLLFFYQTIREREKNRWVEDLEAGKKTIENEAIEFTGDAVVEVAGKQRAIDLDFWEKRQIISNYHYLYMLINNKYEFKVFVLRASTVRISNPTAG